MVVKISAAASSNKPQPNPWEALISSATRARPTRPVLLTTAFSGESDDGSGNTSLSSSACGGGGYTVLLQHSLTPKSQRKWALESTMSAVDKSSNNSSNNINSGTRSNKSNNTAPSSSSSSLRSRSSGGGDWYGISGPFLVRQALHDLSTRCNGRVVFVSVAGTTSILDLDALHDDNDASSSSSLRLFRQNGACVDLSSNPFGWNNDENYEDRNHCNNNSFVTKATMSNLQSLASAIRQAASNIIISRSKDEAIDNISKDQKSKSEGNLQLQQPIPIIFETMTPLLQLHGVERITVLLKSLGRMTILDNNDNNSSNTSSVLSPIIVPVLYESICLSDHRTLEDCADAMVSLKLMDTVTSATTSIDALDAKDDKDIVVVAGVMDLVRRGGGGGGNGGLGGKLMRHCVPIHILRSKTATTMGDLRNSCYWIVGSDDKDNTRQEGEEDDDVTEKGKADMRSSNNTVLDQSPTSSAAPKSSRPQIYLQDDDPDFQDYDEDDDLDL